MDRYRWADLLVEVPNGLVAHQLLYAHMVLGCLGQGQGTGNSENTTTDSTNQFQNLDTGPIGCQRPNVELEAHIRSSAQGVLTRIGVPDLCLSRWRNPKFGGQWLIMVYLDLHLKDISGCQCHQTSETTWADVDRQHQHWPTTCSHLIHPRHTSI